MDPESSERDKARIERLGRQRPEAFKSDFKELGFVVAVMLSIMCAEYYISGFSVILPTLTRNLNIPSAASTWPSSAFALVAGSVFLVAGRIADMYGGYYCFLGGLAWSAIWSIAAGFAQNDITIDVCRAMQGFGPAFSLPASIMLIGKVYRPGPRKNMIFSLYGGCGPIGYTLGILMGGIAGQLLTWRWYFWIGSIITAVAFIVGIFAVPSDAGRQPNIHMDVWGSLTIVAALILLVASITQSSRAPNGWETPYVIFLLILSLVLLAVAVYVEGWIATTPLLPFDFFRTRGMLAMTIALFFSYGTMGIWLFYTTFYLENILKLSPLLVVAWYIPFGLGGLILPTICGVFLHTIPGTILLIVAAAGWVAAPLLISFTDPSTLYWRLPFPAMICGTIGIDITYNISNIWITTSLVEAQQGLAGALINTVLFLGNSFFLGWADVLQSYMLEQGKTLQESYKITLWFAAGCATVPLILFVIFIRVDKAHSALTADEKLQENSITPEATRD